MSETDIDSLQFSILKDCIAQRFLSIHHRANNEQISAGSKTRSKSKTARLQARAGTAIKDHSTSGATLPDVDNASEDLADPLDDFATYLAAETWDALPPSLRDLAFSTTPIPSYTTPASLPFSIPPTIPDTLIAYSLASDEDDVQKFIHKVVSTYIDSATAPPPVWKATRTEECEICERQVPLTYHHLIPRSTHDKVLKKGWHPEEMLNSVAWLCRQCHSAVHHVAPNEELARNFYTVELLLEREDIQKWKKYAAKQRFGYKWRQNREY
ncbi:hypothetical protein CVT24_005193 [Panaeolus cyanescens]|uniref:HNH domain-containing protein n=1 Tax=Panaeolus cyanescens TaxID=181874 RepID=A0A409Y8Z8_9AGAR|nr:hypothetical protein CVT24_005193 [Panaeolus cyanescens]